MPYSLKKVDGGYHVVEGGSGDRPGHVFSKAPQSKAKAIAQLMILRSKERGGSNGDGNGGGSKGGKK